MSDPVSNHDIEDVLSSIRRLVAQGDPRKTDHPSAPKASAAPKVVPEPVKEDVSVQDEPTERLVLTPAFRVLTPDVEDATEVSADPVEEDETAEAATESVVAEFDTIAAEAAANPLSERASLEAKIAALEAAVSGVSDDFEPDGSEVIAKPTLETTFLGARDHASEPVADDEDMGAEASLNSAVVDHIAATVASEIAGAFPHLNAAEAAPEEDQTVVPLKRDMPAAATPEPVEALEVDTPEVDTPDEDVVVVAPKIHKPAAFRMDPRVEPEMPEEAADAAAEPDVEVVAPAVPDAPTFRRSSREVYDPVAEATADAAEAAENAGDIYGDELVPDADAPGTAVAEQAAPTALMDPDMMRDMVSQMIREELQGEMGERITRNVRKLVRREINRVLSAQEFD